MKRIIPFILGIILILGLAACGKNDTGVSNRKESENETTTVGTVSEETTGTESGTTDTISSADGSSNILIAYFSVPEDVNTKGKDAIAGASIVVKDEQVMGNTEYVAKLIQKTIGGDLFRIETTEQYPLKHDTLVDLAAEEQDENKRPELAGHIEDFEKYDVVILGYPNWWADLPMPVYSFLEEYDLDGKTIIPFVTHGGSGFSKTVNTISKLQPKAQISDNTLSISRNNIADCEEEVIDWADGLK